MKKCHVDGIVLVFSISSKATQHPPTHTHTNIYKYPKPLEALTIHIIDEVPLYE